MPDKYRQLHGIYGITDPTLCPQVQLLVAVEQALEGGVRVIQYRDKPATSAQRLANAKALVKLCEHYQASLIINDDLTLCLASGAHGVHLGRSDGDIAAARQALGPDRILGVTCHGDVDYAHHATQLGADYCAFGRIFPSRTKPEAPPCSLEVLAEASARGLRTVAIGGIDRDNVASLLPYRPDMVAVIHGLFGQSDVFEAARELGALFEKTHD